MKRKIILVVVTLFHFTTANAQIRYEKLDSLSAIISTLEKQTDGKAYKDEKGNIYTLSFPGENFKTYFYNKLATKAVYKEANGKEILALTENIDFSKATGLLVSDNYNGIAYIKVDFPKGHLKTQLVEDGKTTIINEDYLEFFCPFGTVDEKKKFYFDKMFDDLFYLCSQLKIEKGITTANEVKNELSDWSKLGNADFIRKYPKSLMVAQVRQNIQRIKIEEEARKAARRIEIDKNLVDLRTNLSYYKKQRSLMLPIYGVGALGGGYLAYYGFTEDKTVLGVGGGMAFLLCTTFFFASNSIAYKPTIRNLKDKINSYEQEKRQLSYLEIAPNSNRIMGNYYAGAAIRFHF